MKKICLISLIGLIGSLFWKPHSILASPTPAPSSNSVIGCGGGLGPIAEFLCGLKGTPTAAQTEAVGGRLNAVISAIVLFLSGVAAIWFLFQFIIAGYEWLGSGGDKTSVESARNKITWSLIGLITVIMATTVAGIIGIMLKIPILNPGEILKQLSQ